MRISIDQEVALEGLDCEDRSDPPLLHSENGRGSIHAGGGFNVMDWKLTAHSEQTVELASVARQLIAILENSVERLRDIQNDASVEMQQQLQAAKLPLLNALVEHY